MVIWLWSALRLHDACSGFPLFSNTASNDGKSGERKKPTKQHALTVLNSREISTAENTDVQARMRARSILHSCCWDKEQALAKIRSLFPVMGQVTGHERLTTQLLLQCTASHNENHVVEDLNREIWLWSRLLMDLLRYAFYRFINELVMCNFILNRIVSTRI